MNQLSFDEQLNVLNMLVEGCSLRSVSRLTGIHRTTIMKLMVQVGQKCRNFLDRWMRNLTLNHIEADEIWTFCKKKQRKLTGAEKDNPKLGDQYLYIALDLETKLIPSFVIGKRTSEVTEVFMQDLAGRLVIAPPWHPRPSPQISTDGWQGYPNAIDDAFGGSVSYGQIIKDFANAEQPGRYAPPELVTTVRRVVQGNITKNSICTSHVERHNLSIRTFLRRFTRLALGFSKKFENLAACTALYLAYYNFCWLHGSLPGTPAMAARIAGHPWTLRELLERIEE